MGNKIGKGIVAINLDTVAMLGAKSEGVELEIHINGTQHPVIACFPSREKLGTAVQAATRGGARFLVLEGDVEVNFPKPQPAVI